MEMRLVTADELSTALIIYERARLFMRENGNPNQWGDDYPPESLVKEDIEKKRLYFLVDGELVCAVFAFFENGDSVYDRIDGEWLNSEPYAAIHRVASAGNRKGVLAELLKLCEKRSKNLKIDTYCENTVMRQALAKNGFVECGTVFYENIPFIAFQKACGS